MYKLSDYHVVSLFVKSCYRCKRLWNIITSGSYPPCRKNARTWLPTLYIFFCVK